MNPQKIAFLKVLQENQAKVSPTLRATGLTRGRYLKWLSEDKDFKIVCKEIDESMLDDVEGDVIDLAMGEGKEKLRAATFLLKEHPRSKYRKEEKRSPLILGFDGKVLAQLLQGTGVPDKPLNAEYEDVTNSAIEQLIPPVAEIKESLHLS